MFLSVRICSDEMECGTGSLSVSVLHGCSSASVSTKYLSALDQPICNSYCKTPLEPSILKLRLSFQESRTTPITQLVSFHGSLEQNKFMFMTLYLSPRSFLPDGT
ncbi:hypothetical protein QVD17_19891 [Tagetes erecta]|uniref:Uncharacterized protein n=1 Tax=Tagetes erecta TaxID=13708 RepID=A0AAD8KK95_TARER|nr:hypothetical protein QVD17_19891 [Tagetes erecta]